MDVCFNSPRVDGVVDQAKSTHALIKELDLNRPNAITTFCFLNNIAS